MLKMDLEYNKGILFVRLKGILNKKTSYKINFYLNPVLNKHKIKYVVYNFYSLEDLDEYGIDAILNSKYQVKNNKGKIRLCEVDKSLKEKVKRLKIPFLDNELSAFNLIEV